YDVSQQPRRKQPPNLQQYSRVPRERLLCLHTRSGSRKPGHFCSTPASAKLFRVDLGQTVSNSVQTWYSNRRDHHNVFLQVSTGHASVGRETVCFWLFLAYSCLSGRLQITQI